MIRKNSEHIKNVHWKKTTIVLGVVLAGIIFVGAVPRNTDNRIPVSTIAEKTPETFRGLQPDGERISEYYTVSRVIDGDTFEATDSNGTITVRLIGVDTPESVAPEESGKENTTEGKEASEYTKEWLTGKTVYLEFDEDRYDKYGRTLAYVYLDQDGREFVNGELIANGLARCMEIEPNVRYADYLEYLEDQAQEQAVGFWGTGFFEE